MRSPGARVQLGEEVVETVAGLRDVREQHGHVLRHAARVGELTVEGTGPGDVAPSYPSR